MTKNLFYHIYFCHSKRSEESPIPQFYAIEILPPFARLNDKDEWQLLSCPNGNSLANSRVNGRFLENIRF